MSVWHPANKAFIFMSHNIDPHTVQGFGHEWSFFDQSMLNEAELHETFNSYFEIFPWDSLPANAQGFDVGCGSGRWAKLVALRVGHLHCIDASAPALEIAKKNLANFNNCSFYCALVESIPLENNSMDFGYSLGVLHHIPDAEAGIKSCVAKLKPGAPFLVYLYYAFDNRPLWFRLLWKISDIIRLMISRLPFGVRRLVTDLIALAIYFPLSRLALLLERLAFNVEIFPLSAYRNRSFYTMRTDALDRFGTQLERRYTLAQIESMMRASGLERIRHSNSVFWSVCGFKCLDCSSRS